ncbi:MAG: citrate/2-methylcitrate synthase [Phycisphaerae bacterium]
MTDEHITEDREQAFLDEMTEVVERNDRIDTSLYPRFQVKRGLRNADGTGVLVGLTEIGDVHGYILDEGDKIPVEGRLRYRGIDVTEIVNACKAEDRFGFEETAYLLLFGQLPDGDQLKSFHRLLGQKRVLPEGFTEDMILAAPSSSIMNKLARSALACYSYDDNPDDTSIRNVLRQSVELVARFPTMIAYGYQAKAHYYQEQSLYIHHPEPDDSTAENILRLIRPSQQYTPLEARMLDMCLTLHAEHGGGNNSTFTTHVITSADTDTYSAIAGAVGSLKGSKHGGANVRVINMVEDIKANVSDWTDEGELAEYLTRILHKDAFDRTGLIYGMGHAVYTLSDPRAVMLKEEAAELAKEKGMEDEYQLYLKLEELGPKVFHDVKKSDQPIAANVDFYSGFVYSMLGIPTDLYTPLFAAARVAGWCAHRLEEIVSGGRIIRPAYKNILGRRSYVPVADRG